MTPPTQGQDERNSAATIVDVARAAGVSHSTVSRVLNGRPHIKPETKKRVEKALRDLGYVANLKARGLAGGRLGVVGLVVLDLESSYITRLVRGVDAALADAGWDLMLCTTHRREARESSYVSRLSLGLCDGLIVLIPRDSARYTLDLSKKNFPFVLLDHEGSDLANSMIGDNVSGTRQALNHLLDLGHERVAVISGDLAVHAGRERLQTSLEVLAAAGCSPDESMVATGDFLEAGGYAAMMQLLDLPERPTAVFASSDTAAFGAMRACAERGVSVPEEMSIVGFDDIEEASATVPPLTTVRQPLRDMAHRAVQLLIEQIEQDDRSPVHLTFPVELIVRDSTAPPSP